MKTRCSWTIIILVLFFEILCNQAESANPLCIITGSNLRVRQEPTLSASEISKLALETIQETIEQM